MEIEEEMKMFHQLQMNGQFPNPNFFFFTEDNCRVIMYSTSEYLMSRTLIEDSSDFCYIRFLYIPKPLRRNGIGSTVLTALSKELKGKGVTRIELESETESLPFFKRMGFTLIEGEENNRMFLNL